MSSPLRDMLIGAAMGDVLRAIERPKLPEDDLNILLFITIFFRRSAVGVGSLALVWSTTVLLGGFCSSLASWDFIFVSAISLISAAGLFSIIDDQRSRFVFDVMPATIFQIYYWMYNKRSNLIIGWSFILLVLLPMLAVMACFAMVPALGAVACIWISVRQLIRQDYGPGIQVGGLYDSPGINLPTALNIFYYIAFIQGSLFLIFFLAWSIGGVVRGRVRRGCGFSNNSWDKHVVSSYMYYIMEKSNECSVAEILCISMVRYAVDMLKSESHMKQQFGVSVLRRFILPGAYNRSDDVVKEIRLSPESIEGIKRLQFLRNPQGKHETECKGYAGEIMKFLRDDIRIVDRSGNYISLGTNN